MTSPRDSTTGTSKFTAHAAALLRRHYRNSPYRHYDDADSKLLDEVNQKGYERLKGVIQKTYPSCNIFQIHRVNAPEMYGMYLLHKEEMYLANRGNDVKEKILYHVTSEANAIKSLIRGLDWRRSQRSRFGSGVSFSNNVDYCNYYANQSTNKVGVRVIIVSTVLMNVRHLVTEKFCSLNSLSIPPGAADTTVSPNGHVFVKYNDFESYPLFFVYYRWTPELLNESKFFVPQNNKKLQRLQEEQALYQQVENLSITKSISLQQSQSRKATLKRQKRRRRAVAEAEAEAAAVKVEAALLKGQNRNARNRRLREAAEAEASVEAALLQRQNRNASAPQPKPPIPLR